MHVSVMEGSLMYKDRIQLIWATNVGASSILIFRSIFHVDFFLRKALYDLMKMLLVGGRTTIKVCTYYLNLIV